MLIHSLTIYIKAAKGESIDDDTDIDKEIALFRAGLNASKNSPIKKTKALEEQVIKESIMPLFSKIETSANKFKDLFESVDEVYFFGTKDNYSVNIKELFKIVYHQYYDSRIKYRLHLHKFVKDINKGIHLYGVIVFEDYYYKYSLRMGDISNEILSIENRFNYSETIDAKEIQEVSSKIVKAIIAELSREGV